MKKKLTIEMSSNLDFNGMVIDISYNMMTIASINYDKGIDNMEIEFFPFGSNSEKIILPMRDFLSVLEKAQQLAVTCAEEDRRRGKE